MRPLFLAAFLLVFSVPGVRASGYDDSGLDHPLKKYVQDGSVDYKALRKDRKDLDRYVNALRDLSPDVYNNWSTASKKAFWINAYNAIALKQAADHYPCQAQTLFRFALFPRVSPQNVKGFFSQKKYRILNEIYSLDLIQRLVLRIRMHDVKILFAVCPAAKGGPTLRSDVYEGHRLKEQIEEQIRAMLKDPSFFRPDKANHKVIASEFFQRFGEDFIPLEDRTFDAPTQREKDAAIREFIMDYSSTEDAEFLKDPTIEMIYTKYDWTLNDRG